MESRKDTNLLTQSIKTALFCKNNLESEYHFLFNCPLYSNIRLKYIPTLTDGFSLKSVLTDHNPDKMRNITVLIFYALKRREEVITL